MNQPAISNRHAELEARHESFRAAGLKLDLTRGKPSTEQLDLSNELDGILGGFYLLQDGTDVRNYGNLLGIPDARILGAEILEVEPRNVMVGGNSSLTLMYQFVTHMLEKWQGECNGDEKLKFICQVPGYDRHFKICEHFDIEMIPVPLLDSGPDMDQIETLVASDPLIKGIWCVPKYSNPTGHTYDEATVKRFAKLGAMAGPDFRIFWDNAYAVHHLVDQPVVLANLMELACKTGVPANEDSVVAIGSTSKITFAGAGISFLAASQGVLAGFETYLAAQTIGSDKVNQLRHVRFLQNSAGVAAHMKKHMAIIKPKFDLVAKKLNDHLGGRNMATWTTPQGGYFVSVNTRAGLAGKVIAMAADVGVKLTPAGATYPLGDDPADTNIRIAPTYATIDDLDQAMDVLVNCIELASTREPESP
jgi:DNA-binding transcriptional MocR family regulator